ncbi:alkaline phosphatase family protein [bacterium]|nr:alkaline phosphatase family protein [bacterium]
MIVKLIHKKKSHLAIILSLCLVLVSCHFFSTPTRTTQTKVILLGLDGAEVNTIKMMIKAGKLAHFKKIMENGVYVPLSTLYPTISPNIWTSIATGKTPEEHGVSCWVTKHVVFNMDCNNRPTDTDSMRKPNQAKPETPFIQPARKVRAFWNIATQFNVPVISVGWMVSDPIEQVNGIQVGYALDANGLPAVYPSALKNEIDEQLTLLGNTYLETVFGRRLSEALPYNTNLVKKQSLLRVLDKAVKRDLLFDRTADAFITKYPWRFAAVYNRLIDVSQHLFYRYTFPEGFDEAIGADVLYQEIIPRCYEVADDMLGRYMQHIDDDTILFVVSDHGFRSVAGHPFLLDVSRLLDLVSKTELQSLSGHLTCVPDNQISDKRNFKLELPTGCSREEQTILVGQWIDFLLTAFTLNHDHQPLFIKLPEDSGPLLHRGPSVSFQLHLNPALSKSDRIYYFEDQLWQVPELLSSEVVSEQGFSGVHLSAPDGIFLGYGSHINKNTTADRIHVYDILPTILAYLGLPVARDMPGKIRSELFNIAIQDGNFIDSYEQEPYRPHYAFQNEAGVTPDQLEELKLLGYINE